MPNVIARFDVALRRRLQSVKRYVCVLAWAHATLALSAGAQTRFELPPMAVHLDRYTTVEDCLAITTRLRDSVEENSAIWRDTVPMTPAEARAPMAEAVTDVARRCGSRFVASAVPLADFVPILRHFIEAGRDSDAATLVARRLKAVSPGSERVRAAVLDTAISAYLREPESGRVGAQPVRLAAAEPLVIELAKLMTGAPWDMRMQAYGKLLYAAQHLGDSACARRTSEKILVLASTLTARERRTDLFTAYAHATIYFALNELADAALLDSLKRSTAGYVAIKRMNWAKATGEGARELRFPIGEQAPTIEGDFWYRRSDAKASRPTKGKIALVVFVDDLDCTGPDSGPCFTAYAQLRRLAKSFPGLEVTLVAKTHGYVGLRLPPPPAAEADTLAHWWLDIHHLPGALSVTSTDFWRLPSPDRRRIDRDVPNIANYSFKLDGRVFKQAYGSAYLIDRSGEIVDVSELSDRSSEVRIAKLLEALFAQQVASR